MARDGLNGRQIKFVMEYIKDFNATRAYTAAGYSAKSENIAATQGSLLIRNPKVKAAIDEQIEARSVRTMITADNVLRKYWELVNADTKDFYQPTFTEDGDIYYNIKNLDEVQKHNLPAFKRFKPGKFGLEIEFHDQQKAMEMVAKHIGMFTEKVELAGKDGGNIKVVFDNSLGDDDNDND